MNPVKRRQMTKVVPEALEKSIQERVRGSEYPETFVMHTLRSRLFEELGRYEEALQAIDTLFTRDPHALGSAKILRRCSHPMAPHHDPPSVPCALQLVAQISFVSHLQTIELAPVGIVVQSRPVMRRQGTLVAGARL
jgi:hypothetical protein